MTNQVATPAAEVVAEAPAPVAAPAPAPKVPVTKVTIVIPTLENKVIEGDQDKIMREGRRYIRARGLTIKNAVVADENGARTITFLTPPTKTPKPSVTPAAEQAALPVPAPEAKPAEAEAEAAAVEEEEVIDDDENIDDDTDDDDDGEWEDDGKE